MITNVIHGSIRLKLTNFIGMDKHLPPEKASSNLSSIFEASEEETTSNSSADIDTDELEVFNKYKVHGLGQEMFDLYKDAGTVPSDCNEDGGFFGEFLDINFDSASEMSSDELVTMELTPFEEIVSLSTLKQTIKNKFRRLLSASPAEFPTVPDDYGENYSPVSIKMPVIEDTEQYNRLDLLIFHNEEADSKIKFNQFVDVLVYNGNYNTKVDSGGSGDSVYGNTFRRRFTLSRNSFRNTFGTLRSPKISSILKNPNNNNYEYEVSQLKEIDKVNFESFITSFENYESCKLNQGPYLSDARLNQLRNYYEYNT